MLEDLTEKSEKRIIKSIIYYDGEGRQIYGGKHHKTHGFEKTPEGIDVLLKENEEEKFTYITKEGNPVYGENHDRILIFDKTPDGKNVLLTTKDGTDSYWTLNDGMIKNFGVPHNWIFGFGETHDGTPIIKTFNDGLYQVINEEGSALFSSKNQLNFESYLKR